jgi:hypothetical protein
MKRLVAIKLLAIAFVMARSIAAQIVNTMRNATGNCFTRRIDGLSHYL